MTGRKNPLDESNPPQSDKKKRRLEVKATPAKTPLRDVENHVLQTPASFKRIQKHLFATPGAHSPSSLGSPEPPTPDSSMIKMKSRARIPIETNKEPMRVFLRIRPIASEESARGEQNCISVVSHTDNPKDSNSMIQVTIKAPKDAFAYRTAGETEAAFSFNSVFQPGGQSSVYEKTAFPLVESFLKGTNGLLFAYGATSAGKTYTISGTQNEPGIIPRVLETVFNSIKPSLSRGSVNSELDYSSEFDVSSISSLSDLEDEGRSHKVTMDNNMVHALWVSYLEIYNERIFDLLSDSIDDLGKKEREPLKLKEDKAGHVFVKGLKEQPITSVEEGRNILAKGAKNRQVAMTLLNQDSSRSHSVLTFKLVQIPKDKDQAALKKDPSLIKYSKLSIVDLAGSERNNRTKTTGARLKESANINTSLMTFGRCIEALRWNQTHSNPANQKLVPFRDSKLTRLFQDYFIGNGKAAMMVNVSPCSSDYDETSNVLKFSAVAKEVSVAPKVENQQLPRPRTEPTVETTTLENLEFRYQNEIQSLELALQEARDEAEQQKADLEDMIRENVVQECQEHIAEIQLQYDRKLAKELRLLQDQYESKMRLLSKQSDTGIYEPSARTSQQIEALNVKIRSLELERTELLAKIHQLEEMISFEKNEKDRELQYWQNRSQREQTTYESSLKSLQDALDREKQENEHLRHELHRVLREKEDKTLFHSSADVLNMSTDSTVSSTNNSMSSFVPKKKSKIVITPTKKDLKKYSQYEIVDVNSPAPSEKASTPGSNNITTLFKGQVLRSVTGDGFSVQFTDIAESSTPNKLSRQASRSSLLNSSRPTSPKITLSPPGSNSETVLFDPLQDSAVMRELDDTEFQDVSLDNMWETKKPTKKEQRTEEKTKEKKEQDRFWKKGKDIAKSLLHHKNSPKSNLPPMNDSENKPANMADSGDKKRGRKLFNNAKSVAIEENDESPPKKRKSQDTAMKVKSTTKTPIARRTRNAVKGNLKSTSYF